MGSEPKVSEHVTVVEEEGVLYEVKYFSTNKTFVFLNMDECPIPDGVSPLDVIRNIKSALHQMGFPWSSIEIRAYGDAQIHDFYRAGIYEGENSDAIRIPIEMINIATLRYREPSNFVVITKVTPKSQLRRVIQCLKSRNNVAAFVELLPDNTAALNSIDSLVNSIQVVGGIERPSCHVHGERADVDVFRWMIAYRRIPDDKVDACSCDCSFIWR